MELFLDQLLMIAAYGLPTSLIGLLIAWLLVKPFRNITVAAAARGLAASIVAYTVCAILVFKSPNDYREDAIGFVFVITLIVAGAMFFFWSRSKGRDEPDEKTDLP